MLDKIKAYLALIRFHKPVGSLLLFFPILFVFLLLDPYFVSWRILVVFAAASFVMRSSGCIINDLWDVKFDRQVKRTKNRPLASNIISKYEAFLLLALLLTLGIVLALELKLKTLIFASFLIIPIIIYPLTKRFFRCPQLFLGATFNTGVLVASIELTGTISYHMWLLYLSCVFWTVGYDTIYAHQDIEDDKKLGLYSSAITFAKHSKRVVLVCYITFLLVIFFLGLQVGFRLGYFVVLQVLSLLVFSRILNLDIEDRADCAKFFSQNIWLALIISCVFIICNFYYL